MDDNKKSFVLYQTYARMFEALSDNEAGELIKAIFKYADNETDIKINPRWELGYIQITEMMDIDGDKWQEQKKQRAEAGRLGGIKRALNAGQAISSKSKQCLSNLSELKSTQVSQANQAVNVNANVNVNGNVSLSMKKFVKPNLEEVKAYCLERNNNIDAQVFIDFYESKGWKIGSNAMKDWKAAVRTWENKRKQDGPTKVQEVYTSNVDYEKFYTNL